MTSNNQNSFDNSYNFDNLKYNSNDFTNNYNTPQNPQPPQHLYRQQIPNNPPLQHFTNHETSNQYLKQPQINNNLLNQIPNNNINLNKEEKFNQKTHPILHLFKELLIYLILFLIICNSKVTNILSDNIGFLRNSNSEYPLVLVQGLIFSLLLIFIRRVIKPF